MTEYINKAKLIKECNYTVCWEEDGDEEESFGISEAMIDLMPTIDIVTCENCRYSRSFWVDRWTCEHPQHKKAWHDGDWFCADGERRRNDDIK